MLPILHLSGRPAERGAQHKRRGIAAIPLTIRRAAEPTGTTGPTTKKSIPVQRRKSLPYPQGRSQAVRQENSSLATTNRVHTQCSGVVTIAGLPGIVDRYPANSRKLRSRSFHCFRRSVPLRRTAPRFQIMGRWRLPARQNSDNRHLIHATHCVKLRAKNSCRTQVFYGRDGSLGNSLPAKNGLAFWFPGQATRQDSRGRGAPKRDTSTSYSLLIYTTFPDFASRKVGRALAVRKNRQIQRQPSVFPWFRLCHSDK